GTRATARTVKNKETANSRKPCEYDSSSFNQRVTTPSIVGNASQPSTQTIARKGVDCLSTAKDGIHSLLIDKPAYSLKRRLTDVTNLWGKYPRAPYAIFSSGERTYSTVVNGTIRPLKWLL